MTQAPIQQPWVVMEDYDENIEVMEIVTASLQENGEALRELVSETVGRQMGYKRPSDWLALYERHMPVFVVEMTVDDWLYAWNHKAVREDWLEFYRGEFVSFWETQVPEQPMAPMMDGSSMGAEQAAGEVVPPPSSAAAPPPATPEEAAEMEAQAILANYQAEVQAWQAEYGRLQGGPLSMLDPLMPWWRSVADLDPLRVVAMLREYESLSKRGERTTNGNGLR